MIEILYIDAHCHIDLYDNPSAVITQAAASQVGILAVTNAPFVFKPCLQLFNAINNAWVAIGLHPELAVNYGYQVEELVSNLHLTRFVGEVGLDYSNTKPSEQKTQRKVLDRIFEGCESKSDAIVSVHSRGAEKDIIPMITNLTASKVILHWFTGNIRQVDAVQDKHVYYSVNLSMLSSKKGRHLLSRIDRSKILTETDGPFTRINGQQAKPHNVELTIKALANVWNSNIETVRKIVIENWTHILNS